MILDIKITFLSVNFDSVHFASTIDNASFRESGHNGESATTFPMIISVGDINPATVILSARSFSSEKTYIKAKKRKKKK